MQLADIESVFIRRARGDDELDDVLPWYEENSPPVIKREEGSTTSTMMAPGW